MFLVDLLAGSLNGAVFSEYTVHLLNQSFFVRNADQKTNGAFAQGPGFPGVGFSYSSSLLSSCMGLFRQNERAESGTGTAYRCKKERQLMRNAKAVAP